MGHNSYKDLQKRLEMHAQGAPPSESLFKILEILFTEKEATLVSKIPIKPFTIGTAAKRWKMSISKARETLDNLADKGILLDIDNNGVQTYILAPTMAGFFEFSLMRTDGKFDSKLLSELFYQYINEEEDFVKKALMQKTGICRTFVHEPCIREEHKSEVLDYERASHIIETATCITVGTCYCRHKMEHVGKACDMPQDVCLTFNNSAKSLAKHGIAKEISKEEAKHILNRCIDLGLVQIGDNVQEGVNWICNCCGCCCEALLAYKKLEYHKRINSNFYAKNNDDCTNCGVCVKKCPVDAIELIENKIKIDIHKCIGCGVCVRSCPSKSISLERRKENQFIPKDSFERVVLNAIEQKKLQNYIFDNYGLWTNDMLRDLVGVLVKLAPTDFILANEQLRSKFLTMLRKFSKV